MQKTLGGDRLGAGKKIKVELHNYERSTHDLGYLWRSTMSAGTLVPFLSLPGLPGDTFDIDLDADIKTHPTIGPLFGSYKVQLDVFMAPMRLYNSYLHNNALNIGRNMSQIKLPLFYMEADPWPATIPEDVNNLQINPSSLFAYLGLRGIGQNTTVGAADRDFNAIPHLAYWEIYKNYYANKQEEIGAFIHTQFGALVTTVTGVTVDTNNIPQTPAAPANVTLQVGSQIEISDAGATPVLSQIAFNTSNGIITADLLGYNWVYSGGNLWTGTVNPSYANVVVYLWDYITNAQPISVAPEVVTFQLERIDEMRNAILASPGNVAFDINSLGVNPYSGYLGKNNGFASYLASQEGLALKTYQSDIFNNWLNTDWIDGVGGISDVTAIDTSGGSFTIDTLVLSKKVYNMLNRIAVSGGSYDDWLDAVYAHDRYKRAESPMYMGGLIKELVFQEVVSNSATEGGENNQPLGTLAGKGVLAKKHKGGKVVIKVDEPCYIIGLISLTPRIDYSQGNQWDVHLKTMDDLHKPALDEIGFQELITEQMAWWATEWNTTQWITQSAGKQPAWINYMTNYNRTYGNFAIQDNEMFMTLNRRYEYDQSVPGYIADLTTYIDPGKFNFIFAQTALDAQNFWAQIAVDITARRKMSAKVMPNL